MVMMMKISKCKKELARIISEHGGWRNGEFAAQDGDGGVGGYGEKPVWSLFGKYWRNEAFGEWFVANKIKNHHQTVLSSEEYFHLHPAQDADGWIEWKGGECPVERESLVDYKLLSGTVCVIGEAAWGLIWQHGEVGTASIIAYRLHKPEQAKPEFCESVMRSIPEHEIHSKNIYITKVDDINVVELRSTIDQLLQDWRNADDFAKRKQAEADEAAAMRDERWKELQARAGEVGVTVGLCESVAAEPEQVNPVKPVMTGKFRNAKIGGPKHYISNKSLYGEICDECGKHFWAHFGTNCNPQ